MSARNVNTPKPTKKRRRVPLLSPAERIELRINRLRKLVVGGRMAIKLFKGEKGSNTTSGIIWNKFRHLELYNWPTTIRQKECVEDEMLSTLSRLGSLSAESLEQLRASALAQARAVLFDQLISESLITKGWGKLLTMQHAYLAANLLREPFCITNDDFVASSLAEGISKYRVKFLRALADIQHNLSRRSKRLSDDCLFVLAANWTNPHCPLWLMSRSAIHTACLGLSTGLVVTPAMIEERLKNHALKRATSIPIVGLELNKNNDIEKFVVSKKFFDLVETRKFTNSTDREYCLVKRPARHRSYCRTKK